MCDAVFLCFFLILGLRFTASLFLSWYSISEMAKWAFMWWSRWICFLGLPPKMVRAQKRFSATRQCQRSSSEPWAGHEGKAGLTRSKMGFEALAIIPRKNHCVSEWPGRRVTKRSHNAIMSQLMNVSNSVMQFRRVSFAQQEEDAETAGKY